MDRFAAAVCLVLVVMATACSGQRIAGDARPAADGADTTPAVDAGDLGPPRWSAFTRFADRTFRGQIFDGAWIASDPCVIRHGDVYRMFYTCAAGADVGGLCQVTSPDGIDWTPAPSIDSFVEGLVVRGRPGTGWDENMETCAVHLGEGGDLSLFYSGYPDLDAGGQRGPASLGQLSSSDGVTFVRSPDAPVLAPVPGGRDGDDIFSAVVLTGEKSGTRSFVYVGWCVDGYHDGRDCLEGPAIQLLGATETAGVFLRREEPVLAPRSDIPWMSQGVAEPDLVRGPDGRHYLFFTGALGDSEPRVTGLAIGPSPFGPWEVQPEPVLLGGAPADFDACGAFAPSVLMEGDRIRMWYLGIDDCAGACPSCNHASCGCDARFTIGYAEATVLP